MEAIILILSTVRRVAHGVIHFSAQGAEQVTHLMLVQSSAVRTAYQFMRRTGSITNEVRKHVKIHYMADLNQRYVADACGIASQMRDRPSVLFGGKKVWHEFQRGKLTKEQWQDQRNSILYSRGDKTHRGNPNIRILGTKLLVNDPSQRGLWIEGDLFLPVKFKPDYTCYDVRIKRRGDGTFQVMISWETQPARLITAPVTQGAIGVDCNPDGVVLVETNREGNLLHHQYEQEQRIQFASKGKRTHDVRHLAKRVVALAAEQNKPLVIEKLNFWHGKQRNRKFNRMRHNFLHKQMLDALKSRAYKEGVEVLEVEPAYTSILGKLKYMDMYSLNNHTAAALVIARRGMGVLERQTFTDTVVGRGGSRVKLEARSQEHTLKPRSWSWMKEFLHPKNSRAHSPLSGSSDFAGIGENPGGNPGGESGSTTGRLRHLVPSAPDACGG